MVAFLWQEAPNIGTEEQVRLSQGALSLAWVLVVHVVKKGKKRRESNRKGNENQFDSEAVFERTLGIFPSKIDYRRWQS